MNVIKRDGSEVVFDTIKIINAITKANNELPSFQQLNAEKIKEIAYEVEIYCQDYDRAVSVEEIQDIVEKELLKTGNYNLTKNYMIYRYQHNISRKDNALDSKILSLVELENEEIKQENSNKNPILVSTQRDYMAGEMSKDLTRRKLLPADIMDAHDKGIIHFHDTDYFAQHMYNCCLINLEDMLQNGTVISNTYIEKPKSFTTACNVATQIMAQVASSQYGGQSITLSHLAPFVDVSRQKIKKVVAAEVDTMLKNVTLSSLFDSEKVINEITEERVREEIKKGVQTIQYQINTLQTTNGQTPFCTIFLYINEVPEGQIRSDLTLIIEEVLKQRMQGVKNEKGVWITPAFPKLIYVLQENNISEESEYFYLTKLAAKCSAKRLVPDYISEKVMHQLKGNHCFPSMGCRSFLSPWTENPDKYYGRFNKGVCTINLIDVACSATGENYNKDLNSFWQILDERLKLCHRALLCRYERLKGTISDVAPILWQNGAIARLQKGETIDKLLEGGYSTISLGYAGLWECVIELIGEKLTKDKGRELGLEILTYMNKKCDEWNKELNLGFGIYGTPIESTTYKFAKCLQQRFGIIKDVTDKKLRTLLKNFGGEE
jgi:ribonucleoside-triphosphate reductase